MFQAQFLGRLSCHFSLTYFFAIPSMIWFLMQFYKVRSIKYSVYISITVFVMASFHMYFFAFFAFLIFFVLAGMIISRENTKKDIIKLAGHFVLQLVIPYILLQIIIKLTDNVVDRTAYPWGFLHYRAYPESVFLPFNKPYGRFLYSIFKTDYLGFESANFVGFFGLCGTLFTTFLILKKIILLKIKSFTKIVDNRFLNLIYWSSFAALLYSFGIPFIFGLENLLDHLGIVRQMRGIARFSWLFYFVINILTVYILFQFLNKISNKVLKFVLPLIAVFFLGYDTYFSLYVYQPYLNNPLPELIDKNNSLPENKWLDKIDVKNYQAIIPIPYFHVGSENIWLNPKCDIHKYSFITGLKTGIPLTGSILSRTSLSQTYNLFQMTLEPYKNLPILKDFSTKKDFMLLVSNCSDISSSEKELITTADSIGGNQKFTAYKLPFSYFENRNKNLYSNVESEIKNRKLFKQGSFLTSDTLQATLFLGFEDFLSEAAYESNGAYADYANSGAFLYKGKIPNYTLNLECYFSFWLYNYTEDLYPRSVLEITYMDNNNQAIKSELFSPMGMTKCIDKKWALCEYPFTVPENCSAIWLSMKNNDLKSKFITIDNFLVRPKNADIYWVTDKFIMKNNRFYHKSM